MTPQETDPDFPVSAQESQVRRGWWPAAGLAATLNVVVPAWDLLQVAIIFTTSTIV